jgi:LysM repeat protein
MGFAEESSVGLNNSGSSSTSFSDRDKRRYINGSANRRVSASSSRPVTVHQGDTLWEIAKKKLGSGLRWHELQKADGSKFTEKEARKLQIGTPVYLSTPSRVSTTSVRRGDTLWQVAKENLGNGNRWRELRQADGSKFTEKEAKGLQAGTQVYFSRSDRRDSTTSSTLSTGSDRFKAVPAVFSTSNTSGNITGANRDRFLARSQQPGNSRSGTSSNTWNDVGKGTVTGIAVANYFPNQPSVRVSRYPKKTGATPGGASGRQTFRRDISEIIDTAIKQNGSHPLQSVAYKDPKTNKWKLRPEYEAGHGTSNFSGKREMFAVEHRNFNNGDSRLEGKGKILKKLAVDIGGVPVERRTAQMLEKQGLLPKGTIKKATSHPGWTRGVKIQNNAIDRIEARLNLSDPDNKRRIQKLRDIANKGGLHGRRTREARQLYDFYTRSLRDVVNDRKANSGNPLTRSINPPKRRIGGEPINIRASRIVHTVKHSQTYKSTKNTRAATAVTRQVNRLKDSKPSRAIIRGANAVKESRPTRSIIRGSRTVKESKATTTGLRVARSVADSGVTKGVLRGASRAAVPVGIALDTWQLGSSYKKHGFGKEFRKDAGSVAGAWGGAAAGAAIGSAIFPGVGTVAGGIIGGVIGSSVGDDLEQGAEKVGGKIAGGVKKAWKGIFG